MMEPMKDSLYRGLIPLVLRFSRSVIQFDLISISSLVDLFTVSIFSRPPNLYLF